MSHHRVDATKSLVLVAIMLALIGCTTQSTSRPAETTTTATAINPQARAPAASHPAPWRLTSDPARLADDLVADEGVLRRSASSEALLTAAAHRQQLAYRALGRHPEWDAIARPRIPPSLLEVYDRNVNARRELTAMSQGYAQSTVPPWRIISPVPADELLDHYRKAQSAHGVGWNYLAAINLIETGMGRVAGVSSAGAQGPMQFLPSTFATYGGGGDIFSPHDSIMAAARYLAANGFARDRDHALYRYNNSMRYVRAVNDYASVLAADAAAFTGYYRWNVYYNTTAGDVLLPVGYVATAPIPVADYLARHPQ